MATKDGGKNKGKRDVQIGGASLKMCPTAKEEDHEMKIFPGSRLRYDSADDSNNNNVNFDVGCSLFGFKLVVQKYDSDESVSQIESFYEEELSHYGKVWKSKSAIAVKEEDEEYEIELKAGEEKNQRIVAIKATGTGASFALIRVHLRGSH